MLLGEYLCCPHLCLVSGMWYFCVSASIAVGWGGAEGRDEELTALATEIYEERCSGVGRGDASSDWSGAQVSLRCTPWQTAYQHSTAYYSGAPPVCGGVAPEAHLGIQRHTELEHHHSTACFSGGSSPGA